MACLTKIFCFSGHESDSYFLCSKQQFVWHRSFFLNAWSQRGLQTNERTVTFRPPAMRRAAQRQGCTLFSSFAQACSLFCQGHWSTSNFYFLMQSAADSNLGWNLVTLPTCIVSCPRQQCCLMAVLRARRSAAERHVAPNSFGCTWNCCYKPFLCKSSRVNVLPVWKHHILPWVLRYFSSNPAVSPRRGK